jgi:Ca2+-binding RTX toxin-like protein
MAHISKTKVATFGHLSIRNEELFMTSTPTFWGNEVTYSPFLGDFGPRVAALSDGTFAIVWDREGTDIVGRHFDELGSFTGGDFLSALSASTAKPLSGPQIFQQTDGRVVVNYREEFGPGDRDIRWHSPNDTFTPHATSFGTETSPNDEVLLDSTPRAGGGAANIYQFSAFGNTNVVLRFTDAIGQQASNQIFVGLHQGEIQQNPALAALHTGFVVVAYENFNPTTGARDIRLHTYAPDETDVSGEVMVSAPGANAGFPEITALRDGSFVVTWQQEEGIAIRHFFGNGIPTGPTPLLIPNSASGLLPKITPLNDGGYIVAWTGIDGTESDGSPELDVFLRRITVDDHTFGQQVHIDKPGDQGLFGMNVATLDDGRVIVTYGSETGDATNLTTLNYQIFDPREATILGTNGDDSIVGREDGSQISGLDGNDKLTGREASDELIGGDGADTLKGFGGDDTLVGGPGNDTLDGGAGADMMLGSPGDDVYVVDNPGDCVGEHVEGSTGIDTVQSSISLSLADATIIKGEVENLTLLGTDSLDGTGGALDNVITGNTGDNTLKGGAGNDQLDGGGGADELRGEGGRDTLLGGSQSDLLVGGSGGDSLTGGSEGDRFIFSAVQQSGPAADTRDIITDFQDGLDRIDLSGIDANVTVGGNQAFSFVGTNAFTAAAQVRFVQDAANDRTFVEGSVDGDLAPEFQIELVGPHSLAASDFVL